MNLVKTIRIAKLNISFLLGAEILIRAMMFLFTIYMARVYTTAEFGLYTYILTVANLFEIIFNLGLPTVFIQKAASNKKAAAKILGQFLPLKIFISSLNILIFFIFALLTFENHANFSNLILANIYFNVFSVTFLFWCGFDIQQKSHLTALNKLILYFIIGGLGSFFASKNLKIDYIIWCYLIAGLTALGSTLIIFAKKVGRPKFVTNLKFFRDVIYQGWPIALSGAFIYIYNYLDAILIKQIKGDYFVGLYQSGYKITGTIFIIAILINQVYLPLLTKYSNLEKYKKNLTTIFKKCLDTVIFWAMPITFGGYILADHIIPFVFGSQYINAIPSFKILIINCIIYFISSAVINLLYALKKQHKILKIFFIGALLNTVFNIWVIPKYGIEGASITTVIAEMAVLFGALREAKKHIQFSVIKSSLAPLMASIIMSAVIITINLQSLILIISIGALVYFGFFYLINKITPELPIQKVGGGLDSNDIN